MATAQEIEGFYGLLGRPADKAGLDYWIGRANEGMPMDAIRQSFQNVADAGTDPLKPNPLLASQNPTPQAPSITAPQPQAPAQQSNPLLPPVNNPGLPSLPAPVYQGETLQQSQDFMRGLIAKGLDVNDPNFYKNPEWQAHSLEEYNKTAPMREAMLRQYEAQGYVGPVGWRTTAPDVLASQLAQTPALRDSWQSYLPAGNPSGGPTPAGNPLTPPGMGHNNPPPGALPGRTPDTAPLTTRPPTAFASNYPYASPVQRQLGAANDQRATPMTQPVGFASNNPLLDRFGTARLGGYTGARETPGNVPGPYTPTANPLPGIVGAGGSIQSQGASTNTGSTAQTAALAAGIPALVGLAGPALETGIRALPGGAALISAFGGTEGALNDLSFDSGGQLLRNGVVVPPDPTTFAGRFNAALKPGWMNVASSGLVALPDLLAGNYTQGIGAGLGSYLGGAAGVAAGAGIGGIAGNFIIPGLGGLVGAYIGRKAGGIFGPGKSVGPNAGQRMAIDGATGMLVPGLSGQDNKGQEQEAFVNKFMQGVAEVVNEANAKTGGRYDPSINPSTPVFVEVVRGKINVVDYEGNKMPFEGNDVENAFKYAVGVATGFPGLRLA